MQWSSGTGGFVTGPVVLAARRLKIPVYLMNVDIIPGKANRFLARFAKSVFVQFAETAAHFSSAQNVRIVGCPLRAGFQNPDRHKAFSELALEEGKKVLLSDGGLQRGGQYQQCDDCAAAGPEALCRRLAGGAPDGDAAYRPGAGGPSKGWILHTMRSIIMTICPACWPERMWLWAGRVRSAWPSMPPAGVPAVCLPYPYHKDRHQFMNAKSWSRPGRRSSWRTGWMILSRRRRNCCEFFRRSWGIPARLAAMKKAAGTVGTSGSGVGRGGC